MPVGIGLTVPAAQAAGVSGATMKVCWDGRCVDRDVTLMPSTEPVDPTCTGTAPADNCSARMTSTGALNGFADVPGLPAKPVQVTVVLGTQPPRSLDVTPAYASPNGPDCPGGGPQAQLVTTASSLHQTR